MKLKNALISLFLLLCAVGVRADSYYYGPVCDDCSGSRSFSWHMENTDITVGSPCGCADSGGDTTSSLTSASLSATQKSDGLTSLLISGANSYSDITSNANTFSPTEGTYTQDVYVTAYTQYAEVWKERQGSGESVLIMMDGYSSGSTLDFTLRYRHLSTNYDCTVDSNKTLNQWIRLTAEWKVQAGNDLKLTVCDLTPPNTTSNCVSTTVDRDFAAVTAPTNHYTGMYGATAGATYYIDNEKLTIGGSSL